MVGFGSFVGLGSLVGLGAFVGCEGGSVGWTGGAVTIGSLGRFVGVMLGKVKVMVVAGWTVPLTAVGVSSGLTGRRGISAM